MDFKQALYESFWIVVVAIALGVGYNIFADKPLPLLKIDKPPAFVNDSLLFDAVNKQDSTMPISTNPMQQQVLTTIDSTAINRNKDTIKTPSESTEKTYKYVNYKQVVKALNNSKIVFIDARTPEDYAKGHIGKALNMYPYADDQPEYMKSLAMLDPEGTYIIYCDGGNCDLSHIVTNQLLDMGFRHIFLYPGGWEEWIKNHQI